MKKRLLFFIVIVMIANTLIARDWYVKAGGSTSTAGDSWENACNVSVLGGSNPSGLTDGDVVYMAAGKYVRTTTITLAKYVTVKGGYPSNLTGTTIPVTRDLSTDSTLFVPGNNTARGLVINATTAPSNGNTITLDGLNFENFNGGANSAMGITTCQSTITFNYVNFIGNISTNTTGAALNMGSFAFNITLDFNNCVFKDNNASYTSSNGYGGAIYFNNGATAKTVNISNSTFKNNKAYGRAAAIYLSSNITNTLTDCTFDSNTLTNATDNGGTGACFYAAGGTDVVSATRCIFINNTNTGNGSVFWFNTTPKNTLNLTDCSLIGNYSSRLNAGRAAVDCSSFATTLGGAITGSVFTNYNSLNNAKASNKADVMALSGASTDANLTFSNSILNGAYISSSNALAAVTAPTIYTTSGYLADSTINLALSGALKITDKIVFTKTFNPATELGKYVHTQIFDVKRNTNKALDLVATIPNGYILSVDGVDHTSGTINIAASNTDPVMILKLDPATAISNKEIVSIKTFASNGSIHLLNLELGAKILVYNSNGKLQNSIVSNSSEISIPAKGFVVLKIVSKSGTKAIKAFVD